MKILIPCGDGISVAVERSHKGKPESRTVRVRRGNLAQDWFKYEIAESGHMAKHICQDDKVHNGSPILCDLSDSAKADGWRFASPKAPEEPQAKSEPKPEPKKGEPLKAAVKAGK